MHSEIVAIISLLFSVLRILVWGSIILSWIPVQEGDALFSLKVMIYELTEPLYAPFRMLLPPIGGFDFSCILVLVALNMFQGAVYSSLGIG
ncbi:MAG: YggT family protein [Candidatus Cloacimonetes bacterium]|nr:YggT family protein [Candidatus Cloacimonadota bacterium]